MVDLKTLQICNLQLLQELQKVHDCHNLYEMLTPTSHGQW